MKNLTVEQERAMKAMHAYEEVEEAMEERRQAWSFYDSRNTHKLDDEDYEYLYGEHANEM